MDLTIAGTTLRLSLRAAKQTTWFTLPLAATPGGATVDHRGYRVTLDLKPAGDRVDFALTLHAAPEPTRLRLWLDLPGAKEPFHLIPGNIHGDNNAAYVDPGQFPCLTNAKDMRRDFASLWEFRADRAAMPVSILCTPERTAGIFVEPYSDDAQQPDGHIAHGLFAALPNDFGASLGYGNDPLTFHNRTVFTPAMRDVTRGPVTMRGTIYALAGGRASAHAIVRDAYEKLHERPTHKRSPEEALRALADSFATISFRPELNQYTNCNCGVPTQTELKPWRAIVEIGWTGGSMMAYPFTLAEEIFPDLKMPKTGRAIFDEITRCMNDRVGLLHDTGLNQFTTNRPAGWNDSTINGWWSGFLPQTKNNHCAYTNGHAAYYLLARAALDKSPCEHAYVKTALGVLDSAIALQRDDGAFGYVFSPVEKKVIDWDGFAGCWFAAALPIAFDLTGDRRYLDAAARALRYYHPFVRDCAAWGSPMDTYKSIDSEGNLAFLRAARLMHERTKVDAYRAMLLDGAHYEYLWRYGYRTRPLAPPLKGSNWNACGGSITSVSNPHMHPMSIIATNDLEYLARLTGDDYHQQRADDGIAWILSTMELYPDVMGYGRYGVLSERTCPSDGLLSETYRDDDRPSSTWWSYNAWAGGVAMEALAERILSRRH